MIDWTGARSPSSSSKTRQAHLGGGYIEFRCRPKSQKDGTALHNEAHNHEEMNVKEASAELGVSIHMIYKLMRNGQLGYLQVGRRRLPLDSSVIEYRQKNTVEARRPLYKPTRSQKTYKHLAL